MPLILPMGRIAMPKLFRALAFLLLAMSIGGCQQAAFAQASPYNLFLFPAQSFTATGQTGTAIPLNGQSQIPSTVGSSYASGTLTLTGTALSTVTFQVMGSADNGATYYALPVYLAASPGTSPVTTVTATAAGLYQINLAGLTHIKLVTSGTFTATAISLTLSASPNASISRNNGSGSGGDTITSPGGTIDVGGTSAATQLDIDLALANTWTQGMTIQDGLTVDDIDVSADGNWANFPNGSQVFEDSGNGLSLVGNPAIFLESLSGEFAFLAPGDGTNNFNTFELSGIVTIPTAFEAINGITDAFFVASRDNLLSTDNAHEAQIGVAAVTGGLPGTFVPKLAVGDVTTEITNTNIKLIGAVTINGVTPGAGATATLENVYTAPGSFTFAHNLNSLFYQAHCWTRSGGSSYAPATWSDNPIDVNDANVTVPSAGDYICSFNAAAAIAAGFTVAVSPSTLLYEPTMSGTQNPTFTVNQSASGGYTGTATYSTSSLASGMTGAFSPTTITGTGSNTLTLSFPATQTPASTTFNIAGNDGTNTHTVSPTITVGNINEGMIECWAGTDGSGNSFADSCGTGNTQTLQAGSLTWGTNAGFPGSTATFSGGAYLAGTNQTATNFSGATPFSVSAWLNLAGASGTTVISTLDTTNNFVGWELALQVSPDYHEHAFLINSYPTNALEVGTSNCALGVGNHFVVMTYSAATKTSSDVVFYLDGAVCTNATPVENSLSGSMVNTKNATLGARTDGSSNFSGILAYTRIYNRVLSSTDVTNYFNAGAR